MATLSIQDFDLAGGALTYTSAEAGGDNFDWSKDNRALLVKNGDASSHDVTLVAQRPCKFGVLHDKVVTVPAGETYVIDDIDRRFQNPDDGMASVTYDAVTSVSVAIINKS